LFADHHHHLSCQSCGVTIAFEEPDAFDAMIQSVAARHGFQPRTHQLEIAGLCAECREKDSHKNPGA
jgi:Fur family ferric uptake transcriptional regulator